MTMMEAAAQIQIISLILHILYKATANAHLIAKELLIAQHLPGDPASVQYNKTRTKWVESKDILKCNTVARTDRNCVKIYWSAKDYNAFVYYQFQLDMFNAIIGAEDCVLETRAKNWLEAKNAFDGHGNNDDDSGGNSDSGAFALKISILIAVCNLLS
ncbi:unnamed protein product [Blepharisma stoltei]|uniref:Uncharacterized protein n=1 Tax=Blepharisma stoltei TaxID=1481888 RepID=A0AAU9JP14_9CILI|nr:unnamed protein product [Blepharisma stoltei]